MSILNYIDNAIVLTRINLAGMLDGILNEKLNMDVTRYNSQPTPAPTPAPTPNGAGRKINMNDPMKILSGEGVDLYDEHMISEADPINLLHTDSLFVAIGRFLFVMSVVIIMWSLVTMLYVNKSEKLAEKKKDIMHKLMIVFLASSSVAILNLFAYIAKSWL